VNVDKVRIWEAISVFYFKAILILLLGECKKPARITGGPARIIVALPGQQVSLST
jgi:hypothetical protein